MIPSNQVNYFPRDYYLLFQLFCSSICFLDSHYFFLKAILHLIKS